TSRKETPMFRSLLDLVTRRPDRRAGPPKRPHTFRPRLEALEDRQLLNASTAFDALGNPLRLIVEDNGKLTQTYLGQTTTLNAADGEFQVLRAHAYRDSTGGIGITVIYKPTEATSQLYMAFDYDHTGGHFLGNNIVDVDKAFDRAGHIQEDVTYVGGGKF